MPDTPAQIGRLLRSHRERARLSQPEAARRAGVSTRLWSEVERGERPNVSFATMVRMLTEVGIALDLTSAAHAPASTSIPLTASAKEVAALREDVRRAAAYGVDLSLLRASLQKTPLQRLQENDEALAFFDGATVIPGWKERGPRKGATRSITSRRGRER